MEENLFLDNLEEYIYDENKLVTYRWLSLNLGVHVNQAKQMLYSFVQHQRNEKDKDDLNVFYAVTGLSIDGENNKIHRVQVIPEENLTATKEKLQSVISCHIYSVQRTKLKDVSALYTADFDAILESLHEPCKHSAITCQTSVRRSQGEMDKFAEQRTSKGYEAAKHTAFPKSTSSGVTPPASNAKNTTSKSKSSGGISGMFASAAKKKESSSSGDKKSSPEKKSPVKDDKKAKTKPQGGVMSFFAKQGKPVAKPDVSKEEEMETEALPTEEEESPASKRKRSEDSTKSPVKKSSGKSTSVCNDDDETPQKNKRRKVQALIESSSEEEEEEEEEEVDMDDEPIPPTPPVTKRQKSPAKKAPVKKAPAKKENKPDETQKKENKPDETQKPEPSESRLEAAAGGDAEGNHNSGTRTMMKKKLVSKTYLNEEGFMVTEKVYEDEEVEVKEEVKKASPVKDKTNKQQEKKKAPAKKPAAKAATGKQTNMMSFFKKKE